MVKINADGLMLIDPSGTAKGAAARATALVHLQTIPGADSFVVSLIAVSAGVTHVWIGASRIKEIAVEDFPVTLLWSDVTTGAGATVKLRGGAQGQPPSWWKDESRGVYEPEPPEPNGQIEDIDLRVGDAPVSFSVLPFFLGGFVSFTATVDGGALPEGWTLTSPDGLFTVDPLAARGTSLVVVTATDSAGQAATQSFRVTIREGVLIEPPVKSGDPAAVIVDVGDGTLEIDFGALVASTTDLAWTVVATGGTLPDGAAIDEDGLFTAPKTAVWPTTVIEATASNEQNGTGGEVTLTSSFHIQEVVVAALAFTAEPVFRVKAGSVAAAGGILTFEGIAFEGGTGPYATQTRIFRDGGAVGAYRAAGVLDYTLVAGDETKAMTGKVRITDSAETPAVIEIDATGSIAIPAPPVVGAMNRPTAAMVTKVATRAFQRYSFVEFSGQPANQKEYFSNCVADKSRAFFPQILAAAAFLGVPDVNNGNTPVQRLTAYMTHYVTNGAPAARGALNTQVDQGFAIAAMLAKRIPAVWNNITAASKARIDRVMEGLLVSAAWQNSDNNPWVKNGNFADGKGERSVVGAAYGRGRVPNFVTPSHLMPAIVDDYMGRNGAAEAFLKSFNRANFAAAIVAAGGTGAGGPLRDLWNTFRQDWTHPNPDGAVVKGRGPTAAELQNAVNQGQGGANTRYTQYGGQFIDQYSVAMIAAINKVFGKNIVKGAQVNAGTKKPTWTAAMPDGNGLFENRNGPTAGRRGRNARVGALTDRILTQADINNKDATGKSTENISGYAAWDAGEHPYGGPNAPGAPFTGMLLELDTNDGGGGTPNSAGPRSSMKYAGEGMVLLLPMLVAFALRGMIDPNNAAFANAFGRVHRGMVDWQFRNKYGHRGYAKGAIHGANDGTSRDWFQVDSIALDWNTGEGLYFEMLQEWAGWPRNTVLPVNTGVAKVGVQLTGSNGTWTGGGAITHQWQQFANGAWVNIGGATAGNYTPVAGNQGRPLRRFVFSTNAKGRVIAITAPTAAVAAA